MRLPRTSRSPPPGQHRRNPIAGTLRAPKGTGSHRKVGWVWVTLMFSVAISSLWTPQFLHFTRIHLFTLTLTMLPLAIWRIRHGTSHGMRER